jgi:hypothetical protein
MFKARTNLDEKEYTKPAITPMQIAAHGSTVSHPAVIATKPARIPFDNEPESNLYDFLKVL